MSASRWRGRAWAGPMVLACSLIAAPATARAQGGVAVESLDQLARMTPAELDAVYQRSGVGVVPEGRVRGRALVAPGTAMAGPLSRGARLFWQGKVFRGADGTAVNRFFGVRIIRGRLSQGASWLDGRPSLILDYRGTSRLYANYRDEIRQVGPNLYLGLMYARSDPQPKFRMYFALQARP